MKALAFSGGKDSMACLHLMPVDFAIYIDTGYSFPETQALIDYASTIIAIKTVKTDRKGQNERMGIPADIVPIDWTLLGQAISGKKAVTIQSYLGCCYENIMAPLVSAAKDFGVTQLVLGQRNADTHKSIYRDGDVVEGIKRLHPIEGWSDEQVLAYLATKMDVPKHYAFKHSSLDCYDCTAFSRESAARIEWMKTAHPDLYQAYAVRNHALNGALSHA